MSGASFILFALSMLFAVLSLGFWAYTQVGRRAFVPLIVVITWAALVVIEAYGRVGVTP